jgi:hypothetical protein
MSRNCSGADRAGGAKWREVMRIVEWRTLPGLSLLNFPEARDAFYIVPNATCQLAGFRIGVIFSLAYPTRGLYGQ